MARQDANWIDSNDVALRNWCMQLGGEAQAAIMGSILAPGIRLAKGKIDSWVPTVLPPPGAILTAFIKGRIDQGLAAWALGKSGVNIGQVKAKDPNNEIAAEVNKASQLWNAVMLDMTVKPPLAVTYQAYWRGLYGEEGTPAALARLNAANIGNATDRDGWRAVDPALRPWPGSGELNIGLNRSILTPDEYEELLRMSTGMRADCRKLLRDLRLSPASLGEIISICSRTLSTRDNSPLKSLWKEFPEECRKWFGWAGMDWDTNFTAPPGAAEGTVRWPQALWANHWRSPGWGQIREMIWRIRADNTAEWQNLGGDTVPLSLDDAREWLKHDGTPPNIREALIATRYLPVSIRYLKTMWQQGIVDTPFAESELKNNGNDPRVVDYIIASWVKEKQQKEAKPHEAKQAECAKQLIKAIEADIELGLLDAQQAGDELRKQGLNPEDWPDCFLAATQRRIHRLKTAILGKVKQLYMTGGLDLEGAAKELVAQGFTQDAATEYLQAWTDELSLGLREQGGVSIARWLRLGLIDSATAHRSLASLGFASPDTAILLLSSDEAADRLQLQAVQALQPGNRVQASAVVRLLQGTERIRKKAQATLRQLFPISRIKREYLAALHDEDWARSKLENLGETLESRDDYLREWNAAIEAKANKASKPKATGGRGGSALSSANPPASAESSAPPQTPPLSESTISGTSGTNEGSYSQQPPQQ